MWLTRATTTISHVRNMCQTRPIQPSHDRLILGSNKTNRNGHSILTTHHHSMDLRPKVHILQITFHHFLNFHDLSIHNSTRSISSSNNLLHNILSITTKDRNTQQHLNAKCLDLRCRHTLQDLLRARRHRNRNLNLLRNGNNNNLHLNNNISNTHPNLHRNNSNNSNPPLKPNRPTKPRLNPQNKTTPLDRPTHHESTPPPSTPRPPTASTPQIQSTQQ